MWIVLGGSPAHTPRTKTTGGCICMSCFRGPPHWTTCCCSVHQMRAFCCGALLQTYVLVWRSSASVCETRAHRRRLLLGPWGLLAQPLCEGLQLPHRAHLVGESDIAGPIPRVLLCCKGVQPPPRMPFPGAGAERTFVGLAPGCGSRLARARTATTHPLRAQLRGGSPRMPFPGRRRTHPCGPSSGLWRPLRARPDGGSAPVVSLALGSRMHAHEFTALKARGPA